MSLVLSQQLVAAEEPGKERVTKKKEFFKFLNR